jgi:glycosyltransferase involved in cell wall biosynthesis
MDRKIRVCQVINRFMIGGAETVALDLARGLDPDRYEVRVLAALIPTSGSGHADMETRFRDAGLTTDTLYLRSFRNPLSLFKLWRYFRTNRFDIVHGHNRLSDAWSVEIGALAGVPHSFWTRHLVYQDMTPSLIRRYSRLSRKADKIFAVSEAVRDYCIEVERIESGKVVTLVNGIDTKRFAPLSDAVVTAKRHELGLDPDEAMVLFVGRMTDQKAPEGFVRTLWRLRELGCPARGFMCGAGPLAADLKHMIEVGPGGVTMLGLRDDVPQLLGTADLFISTSRNEGLPLNVMEAMSSGTAFLAPDIEQISCLLTNTDLPDTCLIPPPPDDEIKDDLIEVWAARACEALSNEGERRRTGTTARDVIRTNLSLERMVSAYQEVYEDRIRSRL